MTRHKHQNHVQHWDDIQYVLAVAEAGSFVKAASILSTDKTTVGRRVRRFESQFGVKIFDRYAGGMRLSPAGKVFLDKASNIRDGINALEEHLCSIDTRLSGNMIISSTDAFASFWLIPHLKELRELYPGIHFEVLVSNTPVDLLAREADIDIRWSPPVEDRLIGMKVGCLSFSLYAAKSYVERYGAPKSLKDIGRHAVVNYAAYQHLADIKEWSNLTAKHDNIALTANSASAYLSAVNSGFGIGLFANFHGLATKELVKLDVSISSKMDVWMVSHYETNKNHRTQLTIDFLKSAFKSAGHL